MEAASAIGRLAWVTEKPLPTSWAPTAADYSTSAGAATAASDGAAADGDAAPASDAGAAAAAGAGAAGASAAAAMAVAPPAPPPLPSARRNASGPWWPCEAVDPWRPPLGFLFTLDHMAALDEGERRRYVPAAVARGVAGQQVWSAAGASFCSF